MNLKICSNLFVKTHASKICLLLKANHIMTDLAKHNPEFTINVSIKGKQETIVAKPQETSDGVEYFLCFKGDEQLTQIRKDSGDKWEQMWGELPDEEVQAIGSEITKQK